MGEKFPPLCAGWPWVICSGANEVTQEIDGFIADEEQFSDKKNVLAPFQHTYVYSIIERQLRNLTVWTKTTFCIHSAEQPIIARLLL